MLHMHYKSLNKHFRFHSHKSLEEQAYLLYNKVEKDKRSYYYTSLNALCMKPPFKLQEPL